MPSEIIVVFIGIGLFLLAGIFGGIGIALLLKKSSKNLAITLLGIGILLIIVYIITLLVML
ncbi:hypothetical protein ACERII_00290 [Evansella sp. AB-rgal1]|uniref:hypothetical protein n=1 Tax=Evansella sp. AB-rgal1 TaxID=3242696 RepID=UPI00359D9CCD